MIDFETLYFLKRLDEFAALSGNGIWPFSEATAENRHDFVFYDAECPNGDVGFPVALDILIDEHHHDMISTWNDGCYDKNYTVGVVFDEENKPHMEVRSGSDNISGSDWLIVIEEGRWYFA